MTQDGKTTVTGDKRKSPAPRQNHLVAHINNEPGHTGYDDIVVFGTEIDALRFLVGKTDWVYAPLANGQKFTEVNGL